MNVFNWDEAARIIIKEGIENASAGLLEDWGGTNGEILEDGKIVPEEKTYTYLASPWATPVLVDDDKNTRYECELDDDNVEWNAKTYWPESARNILKKSPEKE